MKWNHKTKTSTQVGKGSSGLRGKKISTNSDFKICYGDVYVIQNCKKQKKFMEPFWRAGGTQAEKSANLG